jgi:hypothetical protein
VLNTVTMRKLALILSHAPAQVLKLLLNRAKARATLTHGRAWYICTATLVLATVL